ncbi:MAG: hypothetical protein EOO73_09035 [Myxococcales bacterium]|nr:MAG: hypothetical protein EOO73_09035 [Myxococcales bacterium]
MSLGLGCRFWVLGALTSGLVVACSSGSDRAFGDPSQPNQPSGGAAGEPSASGGSRTSAGASGASAAGTSGSTNGGSSSLAAGDGGMAGDCAAGECEQEPGPNPCAPNPCKNEGVCHESGESFVCECTGGFAGTTCTQQALEALPLLPGATSCDLAALSGSGAVAVGDCNVDSVRTPFWWKPAIGTKALSTGFESGATALTSDGTFVVGYSRSTDGSTSGVSWFNGQQGSGYQGLVYNGQTVSSRPSVVSDDGMVVAGESESLNGSPRAVRWVDHGEAVLLGTGHGEIYVKGMSGDGKVIVGYAYDPDAAIVWTPEGGLANLPVPEGVEGGVAFGVSRDGRVIVGEAGGQAVRWVAGAAPQELGVMGSARAASKTGDVIVGRSGGEAMIWDEDHGARLLSDVLFELGADVMSWTLSEAVAVSADGRVIAGNGSFGGMDRVWLARLP